MNMVPVRFLFATGSYFETALPEEIAKQLIDRWTDNDAQLPTILSSNHIQGYAGPPWAFRLASVMAIHPTGIPKAESAVSTTVPNADPQSGQHFKKYQAPPFIKP